VVVVLVDMMATLVQAVQVEAVQAVNLPQG
jgi:hypothetical protein